jgi:branched-chain amino acid transport system permease protein
MQLIAPALISGVTLGLLYGLLAFAVVVLNKATGLVNFAQGAVATLATFVVWYLASRSGWPLWAAVGAGVGAAALIGTVCYLGALMPRGNAGPVNLTTRTLAIAVLIEALVQDRWGQGQPYPFPSVVPASGITVDGVLVPYHSFAVLGATAALLALVWFYFHRSRGGLLMRATADGRDVARLLGVRVRRVAASAWALAAVLSLVVGVLSAPMFLLSTNMMDGVLLYSFAGLIIGGVDSLPGAIVGGLLVGLVGNVVAAYTGPEWSVISVFGVLTMTLLVRPQGLFSRLQPERL